MKNPPVFLSGLQVPFLSPLEGHIYLQLDSKGHSNVQHQGFLVSSVVFVTNESFSGSQFQYSERNLE